MKPLLAILNPRRIDECISSIEALDIDKAWLSRYTESQLCDVFPSLTHDARWSHIVVVSDDCVVSPDALAAVLELLVDHPVVTGYCNLDESGDPRVNLSASPLSSDVPSPGAYDLCTIDQVEAGPDPVSTYFAGFALTGMSCEMWRRFPFDCFGSPGYASDFKLSLRLQQAGIPIVAPKAARLRHLKAEWNLPDTRRPLLVGQAPAEVRVDIAEAVAI